MCGVSWGLFILLASAWEVRPMQAASIISVLSLSFLPLYVVFFYNDSGFQFVSLTHIIFQVLFQGPFNSIISFALVVYATQRLGAQKVSLFAPFVPLLTTLFAVFMLGEIPVLSQWAGVVLVGLGTLNVGRLS